MKKHFTKAVSLLIVTAVLLSCFSFGASAATYRNGTNGVSSSYASSKYYKNFQQVTLTGDGRADVIALALSQLGYCESDSSSDFSGLNAGSSNYTEYCHNMGDYGEGFGYQWCASFCSWALYQSGCTDQNSMSDWCRNYLHKNSNYIWREVGCPDWSSQLKYFGYFEKCGAEGGTYTPQSGDLIFFYSSGGINHIGFVLYSANGYVYTVEGNTGGSSGVVANGGKVWCKSYSLNDSYIAGYGVLPYKTVETVKSVDFSGANPTAGLWITEAYKYLYADAACTTRATYSNGTYCDVPIYTVFEATGVTLDKKALEVTYDGVSGYISINSDDPVRQISCSEEVEGPEENLATDLDYTVSVTNAPLVESEWGTDYSALLTDGNAATEFDYTNGTWFIFNSSYNTVGNKGTVTIDFENICEITKLRLHLANAVTNMSVNPPSSVEVYGSANGIDYNLIGEMPIDTADDIVYWSNLEVDGVTAGSVRFEFNIDGIGAYVNEIEVHGTETETAYVPQEPVEDESSEPEEESSEPIDDETSEPVEDITSAPVEDESSEPVEDETSEPVEDESSEPIENESSEPVEDITSEPIEDVTSEPTEEDSSEPDAFDDNSEDSTDESMDESVDDSSDDSSGDITDESVDDNSDDSSEPGNTDEEPEEKNLGDINGNGEIDSLDYILLKRAFFNTYKLDEEQSKIGDINQNGEIDSLDYILLKRAYFGTYKIK